jgi:hypothetical protein
VKNNWVMTAIALQQKIIKQITQIEDVTILKSVEVLLKSETKPRKLTALQKKLIEKAEEEYKKGDVVEHNDLMTKIAAKYGW